MPDPRSNSSSANFRVFLWRVIALHMITYFLVGLIAFNLFSYGTLYASGHLKYFMIPIDSLWVAAGPALQILRGILFAIILWPFRTTFLFEKYGWLKLWLLFVGLAILGTTGPSPGSLEGMIYTNLSFFEHISGMPEVLLQTLLFSLSLSIWYKKPSKLWNIISIILVILILLMSAAGFFMRYSAQART
jgi:hypothetical protein